MNKNLFSKLSIITIILSSFILWSCAEEDIDEEETSIIREALPCWNIWCPASPYPPVGTYPSAPSGPVTPPSPPPPHNP